MRALLFHAPAYTADGYDDTRPRLVRAACKGSDNNVERRDIPENGLSVSDWYLRNILYIDTYFSSSWRELGFHIMHSTHIFELFERERERVTELSEYPNNRHTF